MPVGERIFCVYRNEWAQKDISKSIQTNTTTSYPVKIVSPSQPSHSNKKKEMVGKLLPFHRAQSSAIMPWLQKMFPQTPDILLSRSRGLATNEYSSSMILCLSKICCVVPEAASYRSKRWAWGRINRKMRWCLHSLFWIEYNMCEPSSPTLCDEQSQHSRGALTKNTSCLSAIQLAAFFARLGNKHFFRNKGFCQVKPSTLYKA